MIYRVILTSNDEYRKTFHRCRTRETSFINYNSLIAKNKSINFPKRFINTGKIKPVVFKICVIKPTEPGDEFRLLRDDLGRTYTEKPIGDWTILASHEFNVEENFWIFGYNSKIKRPTIETILKKLLIDIRKRNMIKQILVIHNKLIIYNEDQFDMVICKCLEDAQRLHHTLAKITKKQHIKHLMFMGTVSQINIGSTYLIIQEHTGWPLRKIRRTTTRP